MSDDRFDAEAIEDGAENFVVIEAVDERFIERDFVGDGAVDHALIQIGGAQAPDFAGEHDVVAVVDFGEVIEGTGLLGKWENVLAAVVFDGDVAFFDVDIRSAVFTHGAEFDEVAIGLEFAEGEKKIQRADYVVDLRVDGVAAVDHGVGSGALFGEMDDGFGLEISYEGAEEFVVGDVAYVGFDGAAGEAVPGGEAVGERADGSEGLGAQLVIPLAADEVVHDGDFVALFGQVEGGGPTAISVSAQDCNLHTTSACCPFLFEIELCCLLPAGSIGSDGLLRPNSFISYRSRWWMASGGQRIFVREPGGKGSNAECAENGGRDPSSPRAPQEGGRDGGF